MDEDFVKLQGAGSFAVLAEIYGCKKCGNVAFDKELHAINCPVED